MSMLDEFARLLDADPNAVMVIEPRDSGHHQWTRAELADLVSAQTTLLRDCSVGPGDCVGVWLPSWAEVIAWQYAARTVGAHVVGVNTRYNIAEVANVLEKALPKVVVLAAGFVGLDLIGRLRDAVTTVSGAPVPLVVPVGVPGRDETLDAAMYDVGGGARTRPEPAPGGHRDLARWGRGDADQLAVAFTTSGSTGLPKLAAHRDGAVADHGHDVAAALALTPDDVIIGLLPYSGTFGYSAIMAGIHAGSPVLLHPSFDPDALLDDIVRFGGSHVAFGDDMLLRMEQAWRARGRDLSCIRWVGIGDFIGESQRLARWMRDDFGTETVGVFGSSEVFALTTMWSTSDPIPARWAGGGHLVSVEMSVRVVGEDGAPLPAGEQGEIQLRGPNVVDEYLGQPEKMAENLTEDGWFRTGDLGHLDDERTITYVCRASDALRLKGFLVEPDEIATRLAEHPSVERAKVVGVQRPGGTEAVGFVTLLPGEDAVPEELIAYCASSLAKFKVPSAVHIIDHMPVTAGTNGTKIKAATLREWARDGVPDPA